MSANPKPRDVSGIIVVHGVGPTKIGSTVRRLVQHWCGLRITRPGQVHQLPNDGWPATPDEPKDGFGMYSQWAEDGKREYLITEVFWADLSAMQNAFWTLLRSVATLVFHLRYIVDCAAVVPGHRVARFQRFLLWWCSMLICGPLAAIYLVILFAVLARAQVEQFSLRANLVPIVVAGLAIGAGALLWYLSVRYKRTWGGTWSLTAKWFVFVSVLLFAFLLVTEPAVGVMDEPAVDSAGETAMPAARAAVTANAGKWGAWLILATTVSYLFAILLGGGLWFVAFLASVFGKGPADVAKGTVHRAHAIALGAACLQFVLWSVIVPMAGLVLFRNDRGDPLFAASVATATRHLILLGIPVAIALSLGLTYLAGLYHGPGDKFRILRFIVNGPLLFSIIAITAIGGLYYVDNFLRLHVEDVHSSLRPTVEWSLQRGAALKSVSMVQWVSNTSRLAWVPWTVVGIYAVIVLVMWFTRLLPTALHVLLDIVNHFYRERLSFRGDIDHRAHPIQETIAKRFGRTLRRTLEMAAEENARIDRLVIVTHSQGTVASILALNSLAAVPNGRPSLMTEEYQLLTAPDCKAAFDHLFSDTAPRVNLITMGSPFHHVYQRYFSDRYPQAGSPRWRDWQSWFKGWVNIYRPDDSVGMDIPEENFPGKLTNVELARGGHVNYWDAAPLLAAGQNPVVIEIKKLL